MVIHHNLAAMNTARNLLNVSRNSSKSSEKLSSGYRINRSADDAAGLSISEKMRAQIRGIKQASTNAQDGISLIQTADGAMEEIQSVIHRINELSVKAANGTYTKDDRDTIQKEVDELINEIDRIADTTEFNTMKLLDGSLNSSGSSFGIQPFMSEDGSQEFISTTFAFNTTQVPMGGDTTAGHSQLAQTLEDQIVPNIVSNILSKYSSFSYLNGSTIGIGLRLYSQSSNTLAYVNAGYQEGGSGGNVGKKEYQLGINLSQLRFQPDGSLTAKSREELEATIAHEMTHAFMAEATTNGMLGSDRFPLWFVEGMAQTASGPGEWISSLSATSSNAEIKNFLGKIGPGYARGDGLANYGTGYLANMYLGYMAGTGGTMEARIQNGLDKIMSTVIGGDSLNDAIARHTKYSGLADFSNNLRNDTAAYDFVRDLITQTGSGRGGLVTGNLGDTDLAGDTNLPGVNVFKLYKNNEKVSNTYSGNYVILSGGGARSPQPLPGTTTSGGYGAMNSGDLILHVGAGAKDSFQVNIASAKSIDLGLQYLSVTTQESAGWAIESCESALERISENRSNLGACQNALGHIIANLDNTAENTQAAESLIRDMDVAKEMQTYTYNKILMQAGQAILAQSNQNTQNILALLG